MTGTWLMLKVSAACAQFNQFATSSTWAEGTISKMKENLKCGVCLDTYSDPKQLWCRHIFCLKCLNTLVVPHQTPLPAQPCRVVSPLPAGGVTDVPSAFQITPFLETLKTIAASRSWSDLALCILQRVGIVLVRDVRCSSVAGVL